MSVRSRVRRANHVDTDLDITAFLNLMVILVPFLLITAVFSSMTVLELNLPPQTKSNSDNKKPKKVQNFELILRQDEMILADTIGGPIKRFYRRDGEFDMQDLSDMLVRVKLKFPDKKNLSILMEPDTPYDMLVQAMDTVRVVAQEEDGEMVNKELFPVISIGDAPPAATAAKMPESKG
ncbi:MAG: ExbD/TolR family protein [Thiohalomonadales bacterium]